MWMWSSGLSLFFFFFGSSVVLLLFSNDFFSFYLLLLTLWMTTYFIVELLRRVYSFLEMLSFIFSLMAYFLLNYYFLLMVDWISWCLADDLGKKFYDIFLNLRFEDNSFDLDIYSFSYRSSFVSDGSGGWLFSD